MASPPPPYLNSQLSRWSDVLIYCRQLHVLRPQYPYVTNYDLLLNFFRGESNAETSELEGSPVE